MSVSTDRINSHLHCHKQKEIRGESEVVIRCPGQRRDFQLNPSFIELHQLQSRSQHN